MKAIRVHAAGGPEALIYEEIPVPQPGPGEARVRVEVAGLNFIDVYQRGGVYKMPSPFTPGNEGAGIVDAVGEGVTEVKPGDRVAWCMHLGACAEYAVLPAWKLVPLPASIRAEQGAAIMLQGLTVHYLTHSTFPLRPGHRALVHAAAGGVGLLLCQVASRLGAEVIGTVGSPAKAELARAAGAHHTILYREQDFAAEVKRITGGQGVHVAYDSVGKDTFEGSLKCLAPRGYMVLYGQSSGKVAPFDLGGLGPAGSLFVTRPTLAHYMLNRAELLERSEALFGWVADGLKIRIDSTFALAETAAAHRRIESRESTGKILIRI